MNNLQPYLGASEPMKDLDDEKYRFRSFEVKTVEKFTQNHLRPFSKRPPETAMLPGECRRLSAVLLEDVNGDKLEQEETSEDVKNQKKRQEELNRQQNTRPLNLLYNPEKLAKIVEKSFEKARKNQNPAEIQREKYIFNVYNEKLSLKDPKLLENLLEVEEKTSSTRKRRKFRKNALKIEEKSENSQPEENAQTSSSSPPPTVKKNTEKSTVTLVLNERVHELPRDIICRRCNYFMRICTRNVMYMGVLRRYLTYRCARKRCQTFRATRKVIFNPRGAFSEQFHHSTTIQKTLESEDANDNVTDDPTTAEGLRDALLKSRQRDFMFYQENDAENSDNQEEEHDPYHDEDMDEEEQVFDEEKKPDWETLQQLLR